MNPFSIGTRLSPWLEQAWMQRYLDRLLTADEMAWFEAYVLDKPGLLARIDADSTLRDALAAEGGRGEVAAPADVVAMAPRQPRRVRHAAVPTWFVAAAALVLGIGVGGMIGHSKDYRVTPGVIASPTRMVFDTLRGMGADRRLENASGDSPYVLVEAAVPPDASDISIEVAGLTRRGLTVSPDGFVSFLLSRDIRDTAQTGTLSYISQGVHVSKSLEFQQTGGKAHE